MKESRRALLFGRKKTPTAPKPLVGLRDLRARDASTDGLALPAARALSAEVGYEESPPPWAKKEAE